MNDKLDYISRQNAIDYIRTHTPNINGETTIQCAARSIENVPASLDVVQVVRCNDCKFYQDNNGGYPNEECRWTAKDETPDPDDFCSYGERKDD